MKLKNKRQIAILELIKNYNIETQEELVIHLSKEGINATQATVSRDIKELHLVKCLDKNTNRYKYEQRIVSPSESVVLPMKIVNIFRDGIIGINTAQNLVIVKCYPGMAQAVCEALDSSDKEEVIGTVAGENTIFVATESAEVAVSFVENLSSIISETE